MRILAHMFGGAACTRARVARVVAEPLHPLGPAPRGRTCDALTRSRSLTAVRAEAMADDEAEDVYEGARGRILEGAR